MEELVRDEAKATIRNTLTAEYFALKVNCQVRFIKKKIKLKKVMCYHGINYIITDLKYATLICTSYMLLLVVDRFEPWTSKGPFRKSLIG